MSKVSLENTQLFLNRYLSWLQFNDRELEEASDTRNPLLARLKFLTMTANNLDEVVEVRGAGLLQQVEQGRGEVGPDGMLSSEVLDKVSATIHEFVDRQYDCWREKLVPALSDGSILVRSYHELNGEAQTAVDKFYSEKVEPLLTPVTVDPAHPFPRVLNKALCLGFLLRKAC